jgi:3-dehydroquinate dehydratase-2
MKKSKSGGNGVLILNGPNLNLLGTLAQINGRLARTAKAAGVGLECFQTNHEGAMVDRIQQAGRDGVGFIILNPAAFTYSSIAVRDALTAVRIPFIEVHLSNIHAREPWRAHSHYTAVAVGSVLGLGSRGYDLALQYAIGRLRGGKPGAKA